MSRFGLFAALALIVTACTGQAAPTSWPGVSLEGDTVFLAFGPQIHALDAESGRQLWVYPAEADSKASYFAEPIADGEVVVIGGYHSTVYGLDQATGAAAWPAPFEDATDHIVGRSLLHDGVAYVPSADYSIYALDEATGERLWSFQARQAIWASPVWAEDRVIVASLDHFMYALDPRDGSVIWSQELGGAIAGTPALADGRLIVGAFDNTLYAVNAGDGTIAWSEPTDGWVWSGPLEADGTLYFGDLAGFLYAADTTTGAVKWKVKPGGALRGTPALADGILYAAARDGFLYFRSAADGAVAGPGEVEIGGQLLSTPVVNGNHVIVGAYGAKDNQLVFAVNRNSGAIAWSFPPPS